MTSKLTDHKYLIFDVYGTLADWESGLYKALQPLLDRYPPSRNWTRKDALTAFGSVESDLQNQHPDMLYSDLLAKVHEVLEQRLKALAGQQDTSGTLEGETVLEDPTTDKGASTSANTKRRESLRVSERDEHVAFGNSIKEWSIFADSSAALHSLSKHFKLIVLSNVDHTSFQYTHALLSTGAQSIEHLQADTSLYSYPTSSKHKYWHPQDTDGSQSPFALVLTAQDTGCYKPALGGFQTILEYIKTDPSLLGSEEFGDDADTEAVKSKVLVVAQSLTHDHLAASRLGIKSVWIDRQGAVSCNVDPDGPSAPNRWTWRFETLGEMADAADRELGIV